MLGPFATTSCLTPIHQMSLAVLSRAASASMSMTMTTTTRDRGDRYGPMEWAQSFMLQYRLVASIEVMLDCMPRIITIIVSFLENINDMYCSVTQDFSSACIGICVAW